MEKRNIIVVGASSGGFEALETLAAGLPADIDASIFVVWHMSADVRGVLPQVLNRVGPLAAVQPFDGEEIVSNRIYVAQVDHHMLVENGRIRITRGPKENRFRPAIDPLFRSAALEFGPRVIGVILSGALDDGTAGLWTIKSRGGLAVVQDPRDAEVPSMPENALRVVEADHIVPISTMAELLGRLSQEVPAVVAEADMPDEKESTKTAIEVGIAAEDGAMEKGVMFVGELTPLTCPDCHGVMSVIKDGTFSRYRCHTGHAFSPDTLLATVTQKIEDSMWSAIRGIEESVTLLNHLGDHLAEVNRTKAAAMYFRKANEATERIQRLREAVFSHEMLTIDSIESEAENDESTDSSDGSGPTRSAGAV